MSTESRKESKFYLRSKEATAGTEDTYDLMQTNSVILTKPPSTPLFESNLGKLGSGEFGTKSELQAIYSPFSIKCSRLTEIAYFMAYCLGKTDAPVIRETTNNVVSHHMTHLEITSRTLPTFSALYTDGSTTHLMTHCIITDFSMTLANGGNGVIDCTFNGCCNLHRDASGTLTKQTTGTAWSSGAFTTALAAESLVNYKGCKFFMGSATEAVPLVHANVAYGSSDLAGSETITQFVNSITLTGNNGFSAEDALRASGGGILNNQERKEFVYTLEMQVRKDDATPTTTFDALMLAQTVKAIEIDWQGKAIKDTYRYAMDLFFPVVQLENVVEDDESPINQTLTYKVYADTQGCAFDAYVQNRIGVILNGTITGEESSVADQSSSSSVGLSSSLGLSSSSSS